MDFGKAFSFVFEDEDWVQKVAIGAAICLTIIGIIPVIGWGVEVIKRVINDDPEPLPDWSEFGQYIVKGLLVSVTIFVYFLPVIIVGSCNAGFGTFFGNTGEDYAGIVIGIVTTCLVCLNIVYGIVVSFLLPAALGNYAASGEFGSVFKIGEIFKLVRSNIGNFGLVFLGMLLSYIIAPLGLIACIIGVVVTITYAVLFNSHLMGQAYKVASQTLIASDEPLPKAS